jgi:hypothetical protein
MTTSVIPDPIGDPEELLKEILSLLLSPWIPVFMGMTLGNFLPIIFICLKPH